jgi:thiol-disulfide isomerase/thioredoxin
MTKRAHAATVVAAVLWAATAAAGAAPDFAATSLAGDTLQLSDYRGRYVVVDFWATWCPPCREQLAALAALEKQHPEVVVLAVNLDSRRDKLDRYLENKRAPKRILLDPKARIAAQYGIEGMPWTVVVDPKGAIVSQHGTLSDKDLAALGKTFKRRGG